MLYLHIGAICRHEFLINVWTRFSYATFRGINTASAANLKNKSFCQYTASHRHSGWNPATKIPNSCPPQEFLRLPWNLFHFGDTIAGCTKSKVIYFWKTQPPIKSALTWHILQSRISDTAYFYQLQNKTNKILLAA